MSKYIIGIDLGGTKIAGALATRNGKILKDVFIPTPGSSANAIYKSIIQLIKEVGFPHNKSKICCVGLGLPGIVDLKKGKVINAPNLKGWDGFPLASKIKNDLKLPVSVDNDANAAALAESILGAGVKYRNFIYITVSTGIGAGIILDKKIYYGSHQTAGELGHTIIDINESLRIRKGGELEALASGTGLTNIAYQNHKVPSLLYKESKARKKTLTAKLIFEAAKKGDGLAKKLVRDNGIYLAAGIANLANLFDPEAIIIGGGLANDWPMFSKAIKNGLKNFDLMTPSKKIKILPAKLKKHSGLYGALALAMEKIKK